jgi:importin subunit beta-1
MREGIAEAYVGITQGLKSADKGQLLMHYAAAIFQFLQAASGDAEKPEYLVRSLVGLLGYFSLT